MATVELVESKQKRPSKTPAEIGEHRRMKMRARLILAAARVVASSGHEKATIDDFIREAKVARGTFYNYFTTREELLEALWLTYGHDLFWEIQRSCLALTDPVERFAAFTRRVLHKARDESTWGWLVIALSADPGVFRASDKGTARKDLISYPGPDLKAGQAAGAFHFDDLTCAIDAIVGMMRAGLQTVLENKRQAFYPEALCKMILLSLGVTRSDAHRISHGPLLPLR